MQVDFHKNFKKQYRKLPVKVQDRFDERLAVFKDNPFAPELNNHRLRGPHRGCRSINVTGDIRAIYTVSKTGVIFLLIDSHSELYG